MSQVFAPTRAGQIADFRRMLAKAESAGDTGMVRAMRIELASLGVFETTQAAVLEQAVPEKPRRGRKPMPRCEHNMIVGRCPDCDDETIGAA